MADLRTLSDAQVLLLAVRFISSVDVESLQTLAAARREVLTDKRIYRLLLTLYPNDEAARAALLTLLRHIDSDFHHVSASDNGYILDACAVSKLTPDKAAREIHRLILPEPGNGDSKFEADALTSFIISWCNQIEATAGCVEDTLTVVEEFALAYDSLRLWAERFLLPVTRLRCFYPDDDDAPDLRELQSLPVKGALHALLRCSKKHFPQAEVVRDLDEVVVPWIHGLAGSEIHEAWQELNRWLVAASAEHFELAATALLKWTPPQDNPQLIQRYAQAGLAAIYTSSAASDAHILKCQEILLRVAALVGIQAPHISGAPEIAKPVIVKANIGETSLLPGSLLLDENVLTQPSASSVNFLNGLLTTLQLLLGFKIVLSIADVALVCMSSSKERHEQELNRILQQIPKLTTAKPEWHTVRMQLHWLRSWSPSLETSVTAPTFLGNVSSQQLDEKVLDCILAQGDYAAAKTIYLRLEHLPLPASVVEDRVIAAIYIAFDNASNGSKNRGGVKRAHELILAFRPSFPHSDQLIRADHLIRATHSLSFYPLTLQHGVPFQPVNIRVQKNPLHLVGKVLDQDPKAYTKLDDLLDIGQNLVLAHLQDGGAEAEEGEQQHDDVNVQHARHTITYLAITSALTAHDFDTAYSYITTRLSVSPNPNPPNGETDDISWRAAYAAGRYKPNAPAKSLHDRITSLSKRMDLLSWALTLAPSAEPLSEILGQWRRCEEEMESLKSEALDEERAFDLHSDNLVPGGFDPKDRQLDANETRKALAKRSMAGKSATFEEQAPMSLFDVASGAARALSRSTKGLRGGSMHQSAKSRESLPVAGREGSVSPESGEGNRVRKRDMVSNMVTSGLVSGMGWVLGAQPEDRVKAQDA
ncbi:hypothetical protein DV736_g2138, partial [Chaetothyriales sp. CBS 134916]